MNINPMVNKYILKVQNLNKIFTLLMFNNFKYIPQDHLVQRYILQLIEKVTLSTMKMKMLLWHFSFALKCWNVWMSDSQFNWEHFIQVLQGINMINLIMNNSCIVLQPYVPQTVSFEEIISDSVCVLVV